MATAVIAIVCGIVEAAIVAAHLVMYVGLFSTAARARALRKIAKPGTGTATVVVPARNEERLIERLFSSLDAQSDPDFRIVLVNDRSTDGTGVLMEEYAKRNPGKVTVVTLTGEPVVGNPKLNALIRGVEKADSDFLLFTDADCIAPPSWIHNAKQSFLNEKVGVILGPIETRRLGSLISIFHAFDHIFKYSYTAGCAGIGMPTGGFGNNLAVRKKALDEIGGFESIKVTSTEDAALISQIRVDTRWKTRALYSKDVTVVTEAQKTWKALTAQEIRWHTGGLFSPDISTRLSYSFIMIYLTLSVLVIPLCFFIPVLWVLPAVSLVTMSLMAVITGIFTVQPFTGYWLLLIPFILLSMVYNSYLTIRALLRPSLIWKGTKLDV